MSCTSVLPATGLCSSPAEARSWLAAQETENLQKNAQGECTYGYVDLSSSLGQGQSLAAYLTRKPSKVQQHLLSLWSQARRSGGENAFQCFRIDCFSPADAQTRAVTIGWKRGIFHLSPATFLGETTAHTGKTHGLHLSNKCSLFCFARGAEGPAFHGE